MGFSFLYYQLIFVIHVQLNNLFHLAIFVPMLLPLHYCLSRPCLMELHISSDGGWCLNIGMWVVRNIKYGYFISSALVLLYLRLCFKTGKMEDLWLVKGIVVAQIYYSKGILPIFSLIFLSHALIYIFLCCKFGMILSDKITNKIQREFGTLLP
jgi:hypothetical protein